MNFMCRNNQNNTRWLITMLIILTAWHCSASGADETGKSSKQELASFQQVLPPPIPDSLYFAGERVPLWHFDVRESLDRELMVNVYFHSQTLRFIKLAPRYFSVIEPILKANNIPDDFKYLALAESGFDPRAQSPAGAAGIWQFMKETAKENGLEVTVEVDERYHLEKATEAACKYLHESFAKYGDWTTVAASYNAGRNGINRQVERQKETHYYNLLLNEETSRYVYRIMALKTIMEHPARYGFLVDEFYPSIPYHLVNVNGPVTDFAEFAKANGTNYKLLKMLNPWLRETFLMNKAGKQYEIKIPEEEYRK
ncbi:MAG: lytic transglycosylase domain-containing protein [Prolixibacteraceae bacterium]|nr:lytic transglycosylase domain-containing protein [Prolixibacteraceae bacterium]